MFKVLGVVLAVFFFVVFVTLGTWQVKRRAWKLDLIARVEQRVHSPAVAAPGPARWPEITAASDEYRHVTTTGTFLDASQTLVQAVTDLGAGYWVLTPLQAGDGSLVLVNRGFVAADDRGRVQPGGSGVTVTGLLRITEPGGAFLRHNNAAANQWYSRDVAAIAAKHGFTHVAPYFIDVEAPPSKPSPAGSDPPSPDVNVASPAESAAAASNAPSLDESLAPAGKPAPGRTNAPYSGAASASAPTPRTQVASTLAPAPESGAVGPTPPAGGTVAPTPGLTVIHFHNSHLVYAITWYTLALMTAIAIPVGMRKQ